MWFHLQANMPTSKTQKINNSHTGKCKSSCLNKQVQRVRTQFYQIFKTSHHNVFKSDKTSFTFPALQINMERKGQTDHCHNPVLPRKVNLEKMEAERKLSSGRISTTRYKGMVWVLLHHWSNNVVSEVLSLP